MPSARRWLAFAFQPRHCKGCRPAASLPPRAEVIACDCAADRVPLPGGLVQCRVTCWVRGAHRHPYGCPDGVRRTRTPTIRSGRSGCRFLAEGARSDDSRDGVRPRRTGWTCELGRRLQQGSMWPCVSVRGDDAAFHAGPTMTKDESVPALVESVYPRTDCRGRGEPTRVLPPTATPSWRFNASSRSCPLGHRRSVLAPEAIGGGCQLASGVRLARHSGASAVSVNSRRCWPARRWRAVRTSAGVA